VVKGCSTLQLHQTSKCKAQLPNRPSTHHEFLTVKSAIECNDKRDSLPALFHAVRLFRSRDFAHSSDALLEFRGLQLKMK
jgi:hypothetical protein